MIRTTGKGRRLARRGFGWALWVAVLVIVVAGAPAAELFCHEEHAVDEHCEVCQIPHPPAAQLSASSQIGSTDLPKPITRARAVVRTPSRLYLRAPARAPPA